MGEYSKIATGNFVSTGSAQTIYLPYVPKDILVRNTTVMTAQRSGGVAEAFWNPTIAQGTAIGFTLGNAGTSPTTEYITTAGITHGISTFCYGLSNQFGPQQQVVAATKANPASFTVNNHGYVTGNVVIFQGLFQSATTGMPQICGIPFVVVVIDVNTFTVNYNTTGSNYTALSGSPSGAYVRQVLDPYNYEPGVYVIDNITLGQTTTIQTAKQHNLVVGSQVSFRIPALYGTVQLNSAPNAGSPGSVYYALVTQVINSTNVVVNINSSAFTAFNLNIPVASVHGLTFPQMVTAGDQNTGGGTVFINGIPTINGPAISGAFVNNTAQGFILGTSIVGNSGDILTWQAIYPDLYMGV